MSASRKSQDAMATNYIIALQHASEIQHFTTDIKANEYALLNRRYTIEDRKYRIDKIETRINEAEEAIQVYDKLAKEEEDQRLWDSFKSVFNTWKEKHDTYMQMVKERSSLMESNVRDTDERAVSLDSRLFEYYNKDVQDAFSPLEKSIEELVNMQVEDAAKADAASDETAGNTTLLLIFTIIGVS